MLDFISFLQRKMFMFCHGQYLINKYSIILGFVSHPGRFPPFRTRSIQLLRCISTYTGKLNYTMRQNDLLPKEPCEFWLQYISKAVILLNVESLIQPQHPSVARLALPAFCRYVSLPNTSQYVGLRPESYDFTFASGWQPASLL